MMSLHEGLLETGSTETRGMSSLPPEVLERIFGFLPEENLYSYCQVCNDWAELIERMPPKITWSPWFAKQTIGDVMLTFRHTYGSRFSKAEDINDMLVVVDKLLPKEQTSNPFINNTVIVNKKILQEYRSLHEVLASFKTQFGPHVHRLIYYLDMNTPQSLSNIDLIFKSLSNLRSLTLCNPCGDSDWDFCNKISEIFLSFAPQRNLSELEFLGFFDFHFLERYTSVHGPKIQSLTVNLERLAMLHFFPGDQHRFGRAVGNCSNLKRLKISTLDIKYTNAGYPQYFKELPVEHLAINNLKCEGYSKNLKKDVSVSQILSIFGDSIETLSFFGELQNNEWRISQRSGVPCQSIKVLNILLSAAESGSFPVLLGSFPNLKKLTLFDREDTFRNTWLNKEELKKICEPFWAHVSPSVESISIRSRMFIKTPKKCFPTLFTCDRAQN